MNSGLTDKARADCSMQRSLDPLLFEWPSADPRLLGSECHECGVVSFPAQSSCPACCGGNVSTRPLATRGYLWTFTSQEFAPKSPPYVHGDAKSFTPFHLGYVELPGEVIVEARIEAGNSSLHIGMPMRLVFARLFTDAAGDEVIGYAFVPDEVSA